MSLTKAQSQLHERYENAMPQTQQAIDAAYKAARTELEARGYTCANDDRAEALVAALYEYLIESAPGERLPRRSE